MTKKVRVAILISGRGSNMKSLIDASQIIDFPAEIVVVGSNKEDALGLEYAKSKSIPTFVIDHKKFSSREEFDKILYQELSTYNIDFICLAGFMRILSKWFIDKFDNKIINIHPSLLPHFKGANAVKDALASKVKITGCTTHFVTPEIDAGAVIMQEKVAIDEDDTYETLAQKILAQEHKIYPLTLELICNKILNSKL